MSGPCPGCEALKVQLPRPWRVVSFAAALEGLGVPQRYLLHGVGGQAIDFVVTRQSWLRSRFGGVHVICACKDPKHVRLGAGVIILWGRNDKALAEYVNEHIATFSGIVILALVPGAKMTGGKAAEVVQLLEDAGKNVTVVDFAHQTTLYIDATAEKPVKRLLGKFLQL